jgi:hypothetical protein
MLANKLVGFEIGLYGYNKFFKQGLDLMRKYIANGIENRRY